MLNYPRNGLREQGEEPEPQWRVQGVGSGRVQGGDSEQKEEHVRGAGPVRGAGRSAAFLLPLLSAVLLVLLCAFLIPCPQGAPQLTHWHTELGDAAGEGTRINTHTYTRRPQYNLIIIIVHFCVKGVQFQHRFLHEFYNYA